MRHINKIIRTIGLHLLLFLTTCFPAYALEFSNEFTKNVAVNNQNLYLKPLTYQYINDAGDRWFYTRTDQIISQMGLYGKKDVSVEAFYERSIYDIDWRIKLAETVYSMRIDYDAGTQIYHCPTNHAAAATHYVNGKDDSITYIGCRELKSLAPGSKANTLYPREVALARGGVRGCNVNEVITGVRYKDDILGQGSSDDYILSIFCSRVGVY